MNRRHLFEILDNGDAIPTADETAFRLPSVPSAIRPDLAIPEASRTGVTLNHVVGPIRKAIFSFNSLSVTVADATVGVGTKIADFPLGLYKIVGAYGSLQFTTTSVLASTLNLSKVINWAVGTVTQTTATLQGTAESDIIPATAATSSATISVANTATIGENWNERILNGATTAADLYLNISVPTAGDIDADATVEVDGTITLFYVDLGVTSALANATRMPTATIWNSCPWRAIEDGQVDGHVYWNDFTNNCILANAQAVTNLGDGVSGFTAATAGTTINKVDTGAPYGKVKLETTTINEDAGIMIGGGNNVVGEYIFTTGMRLWFEARVSVLNVTVTKLALLVAFAEEALCATTATLAAGGATIADKDYIGFIKRAADTVGCDVVHNTAGGGGETIKLADAATFAADTFTKLGIYCDGTTIYFYQDGTQLTSVALSATNVPDGEEMALYIVLGAAHGDTCSAAIDWVKIAQQRA